MAATLIPQVLAHVVSIVRILFFFNHFMPRKATKATKMQKEVSENEINSEENKRARIKET